MDGSGSSSSNDRKTLTATRKVLPPPPSMGQASTSTAADRKMPLRPPPPPPSIGSASSASGGKSSSNTGSKRGSDAGGSTRSSKKRRTGMDYSMAESSDDEPDLTPEQRHRLMIEQKKIIWIPHVRDEWKLTYDSLALGRFIGPIEPEHYVDTTYCRQDLLQKIMDAKYAIKAMDQDRFFELRAKLTSFVDMENIHFHNRDALRMANIDAMMGYQLSNPKNARGETLLQPNELLYFVDICGAPGGAAEYLLWKKKWYAHGFGFCSKSLKWDLPPRPHYSAESFEACYGFWGEKGNGDIYNPEEVQFFIRQVRRSTDFVGAHVVIAQGGDTTTGDEDRKELRVKYMIMSEFAIALDVLREGGHFVVKIHDMFTPFTVGLVYLMYRTFDSVAIYKPETGMPASSERYILCKYRKSNRYSLEVYRYLMESLTMFRNTQRLHKTANDEVADIINLVPPQTIRDSYQFYKYVVACNEEFGLQQLRQTDELNQKVRSRSIQDNYLQYRMEQIRTKAAALWGVQYFQLSSKFTDATTPEIRAGKLVRPYPTDILSSIVHDGEHDLSFANIEDELVNPKEWNFVPIGRDRGFFLGLGGKNVYQFTGTEWVPLIDKLEMCNNTLVYGDMIDEITIFEDKQIIKTGFHIIDAMLLGGKDIRALPFVERNELCQKFAKSMNKAVRDDLVAVRCERAYKLNELPAVLATIKRERLKGGGRGPSKEIILPVYDGRVEESSTTLRPRRAPLVFKPTGFSLFKTDKGGGVQGDFLYTMQNRLNWRLTDDVNVDPNFDGWKQDAADKYGPIHGATFIDFLVKKAKK